MVDERQWKIIYRVIGALDVVQVHAFINKHSHSVDDVVASQPLVKSNRAVVVIDGVIRSTHNYQLRKICRLDPRT